jgi:quinol-cytochrome oxidoreductase complex cytochrome b subunit
MSAPTEREAATPRGDWVGWLERRINLTQLFSIITHFGLVYTPVDASRPLREVLRDVGRQQVPTYATWPRVLGVLAAILFAVEAITGVLLAYYYRPTSHAAFESTRTILRDLPFGWFVHQIHAWGAWLLVAVLFVRLFRLFWDGLYRAPRELLWLSAIGLCYVVLQFDFTGRLLTWDTHSYWTVMRGLEVVLSVPVIGNIIGFLIGGSVVNDDVLIRFYILHLMVLPILYLTLLYLTFGTQRRVGLGQAATAGGAPTTTLRRHLYSVLILAVIAFGIMVTLAVLVPFRFMAQADPYSTPTGMRPPWYLLAPYALIEHLPAPAWLSGFGILIVSAALILLPFGLRNPDSPQTVRRARIVGIALIVVWLGLTVFGLFIDRGQP